MTNFRHPIKRRTDAPSINAIVALAIACWFVGEAHGGVIAYDSNNIVTSWASNTAGGTYYFYEGSYNDNSTIIKQFSWGSMESILSEFNTDLMSTTNVPTGNPMYAFDKGESAQYPDRFFGSVFGNFIFPVYTWSRDLTEETHPTATTYSYAGTTRPLYWASTTAPSSGAVPEPSTAIAMGLLGIVGFAGNRRRRRTALNA